ncbi:hypothetical protein [Vibrio cholerae]|uniref:hypothetical protein n=1 Tax=Vibrio cholerae TaxID=666 RepID=UPI00061903F6|nr:hypothetical protein [Vibrio cholerae]CFW14609.1 hypothetical protein [Vibrio cholerae]CPR25465.1 hypothetical protein [Vibrio cholerae]CPR25466.1 hypothetical protein [Vibrio cholerae]
MTKLVLLGTYWNEAEWIDSSLAQVTKIAPDLTILCDGCFDSSKDNRSNDGTREKISQYCELNDNAIMFTAVRKSRLSAILFLFIFSFRRKFSVAALLLLLKHCLRTDRYRLNQAVTFCQMLEKAISITGENIWFMTYDADQFYDDSYVSDIKNLIIKYEKLQVGLLTAKERTFTQSFDCYTDRYESRTWNNLPHKYYSNTMIMPTRDIVILDVFSVSKYIDKVKSIALGDYFHYKFRTNKVRSEMTYQLGDRKPPSAERTKGDYPFNGKHPSVIER